jgi:putative heme-binding domain-containing protein
VFVSATNRVAILREYESAASLKPRAGNGAELFETHCATCHAHGGRGFAVGPNLMEFAGKGVQDFLMAIIDPNAAVDPKFVSYDIETKDGRSLSGIVKNESASALTLVQSGGVIETVLRSAVKEMRPLRLSLMPEGLEQNLSAQDMADLIAWIKHPN